MRLEACRTVPVKCVVASHCISADSDHGTSRCIFNWRNQLDCRLCGIDTEYLTSSTPILIDLAWASLGLFCSTSRSSLRSFGTCASCLLDSFEERLEFRGDHGMLANNVDRLGQVGLQVIEL